MNDENDLSWNSILREAELVELVSSTRLMSIDPTQTIDSLGNRLLPKAIDGDVMYGLWPDYWVQLKKEFQLFVCTNDKKYKALRKKLSNSADKSQTAVVSTIAAAMAAHFGVVAGVLVPFCAMCLIVLLRTGKEAFCATFNWNTPLIAEATKLSKNG